MQIQRNNVFFGKDVHADLPKIKKELGKNGDHVDKQLKIAMPKLWEKFSGPEDLYIEASKGSSDYIAFTIKDAEEYQSGKTNGKTPVKQGLYFSTHPLTRFELSRDRINEVAEDTLRTYRRSNDFDNINEEMNILENNLKKYNNSITIDKDITMFGTPVVKEVREALPEIGKLIENEKNVLIKIKVPSMIKAIKHQKEDPTCHRLEIIIKAKDNDDITKFGKEEAFVHSSPGYLIRAAFKAKSDFRQRNLSKQNI